MKCNVIFHILLLEPRGMNIFEILNIWKILYAVYQILHNELF